jgi:hypothetical protein
MVTVHSALGEGGDRRKRRGASCNDRKCGILQFAIMEKGKTLYGGYNVTLEEDLGTCNVVA